VAEELKVQKQDLERKLFDEKDDRAKEIASMAKQLKDLSENHFRETQS
jgi:hypothetical protein